MGSEQSVVAIKLRSEPRWKCYKELDGGRRPHSLVIDRHTAHESADAARGVSPNENLEKVATRIGTQGCYRAPSGSTATTSRKARSWQRRAVGYCEFGYHIHCSTSKWKSGWEIRAEILAEIWFLVLISKRKIQWSSRWTTDRNRALSRATALACDSIKTLLLCNKVMSQSQRWMFMFPFAKIALRGTRLLVRREIQRGSFPSNVTYYMENTVMKLYLYFVSLRVDDEGNAESNMVQEGDWQWLKYKAWW